MDASFVTTRLPIIDWLGTCWRGWLFDSLSIDRAPEDFFNCPGDPARALVRRLIAEELGVSPAEIDFQHDPHGRPSIELANGRALPAHFDLSVAHANGVWLVALGRSGRIGADVEVIRPEFDFAAIAKDHLLPAEQDYLISLPAHQRPTAFFSLWTAKEAALKAIGLGVAFGLDQIEIALDSSGTLQIRQINHTGTLAQGWRLAHRLLRIGDHPIAACVAYGVRRSEDAEAKSM